MAKKRNNKSKQKQSMPSSPIIEKGAQREQPVKKGKRVEDVVEVTMEALKAMSDSDDDSGLPPEEEWDEQARSLKKAIEAGLFNQIARQSNSGDDSIEEVDLESSDDSTTEAADDDDDDGQDEGEHDDVDDEDDDDGEVEKQIPKKTNEESDDDDDGNERNTKQVCRATNAKEDKKNVKSNGKDKSVERANDKKMHKNHSDDNDSGVDAANDDGEEEDDRAANDDDDDEEGEDDRAADDDEEEEEDHAAADDDDNDDDDDDRDDEDEEEEEDETGGDKKMKKTSLDGNDLAADAENDGEDGNTAAVDEEKEKEDGNNDNENEEKNDSKDMELLSSVKQMNNLRQKPLRVMADNLLEHLKTLTWPETFEIVSTAPLPFHDKSVDIHDDLKREVAFYDMALEAAIQGRRKCEDAAIPFSRPDNFFAEMVKTDDHMAKIKDRLIFENKKIDAVNQRKANKEQKLRAKESRANKVAHKAKQKKDNLKAVEEWSKKSGADQRLEGRPDNNNNDKYNSGNKKRLAADKKWGFGGKKGRFKQMDGKTLSDMSGFNPKGNFAQGQKRSRSQSSTTTSKRPGKRARDASRSRGTNR